MKTLNERYNEVLNTQFSGIGGICKKYVIIILQDNFFKKEFIYNTEEEATIVYSELLGKGIMHREDVLLTIRYMISL